jgi:hypothetical protein
MMKEGRDNLSNCRSQPGIVLLITLVLLVVLSTLGYTVSSRVAAQRHRDHYIISYQVARYGCDSAVKYALTTLYDINTPSLIARPNEPDFSDLFGLDEAEYEELLAEWAAKIAFDRSESFNDTNGVNNVNDINSVTDFNDPNSLVVRGPYGPPWPFITEPVNFEIASAAVSIEIEDENAKYPLGWAMLDDEKVQREIRAGFETFCEWMDVNDTQIDSLKEQLKEIEEIKPFKLNFQPIKITERKTTGTRKTRTRRTSRRRRRSTTRSRTVTKTIPATVHITDFAKLFHSSLIDAEALARPTVVSETRKESALKYIGMWGSRKVNINTAPRHVLEAAFTFGGDADKIVEEIILRRQIEPFKDIADLRKSLFRYSDSIEKCEKYITTVSRFFTIKVTAVSGVAKASAIIAITKDDNKIKTIAVISG